ncbi:glycosyltransferase [Conexibacter sp. CPCC 206217]|uniref:glycosyltransferase family 2 protein n=1 Tax=Conexibacter sp. CPCC 206217 TaxID=3064574 RepID=UPI002725D01F|nr:glycosyltransferase [Conexibacter sp. CPCC 206217]MDO8209851.1 glycosyltransferase [Conexibacter sp. CPCC 206217]
MITQGQRRLLAPPAPLPAAAPRERPTISVVIPYYRAAHVIAEAVASALEQTLAPDEIVICDDGSPDDLDGALGALRERVIVVRRENGGAAAALNTAAGIASGEFIVQLDSDDTFMPTRIEAISDAIVARPDLDVIATDALIELDGSPVVRFREATPFETEFQRVAVLKHCFFAWPAMRRSRFMAVGGYDERYRATSDWAGFIRLVLDGASVGMVDEPLYRWRLQPGSISSNGAFNAAEEIRLLQDVMQRYTLAAEELAQANATIALTRQRGLLLEAKEALTDGRDDARNRAFAVVTGSGFTVPTRLKAAATVVSPSLARRALGGRFGEQAIERRFGADPGA